MTTNLTNNKIMFLRFPLLKRRKYYHPYNRTPPLQIGYMISLLKKEYKIKFLDGWINRYSLNLLLEKTKEFGPSIIVMSFTNENRESALEYATGIKEFSPRTKIVSIGPYASTLPQTLIFDKSPIDFVLMGECELDLVDLLKNLNSTEELKKIRSLYFKEKTQAEIGLVEDLDKLPLPEHSLFNPKYYFSIYPLSLNLKLKWGYILSSRGCPYQCIYCSPFSRTTYSSRMRYRSIENVIEEMLYLRSMGINIISFEDDNFTISKERTLELCREIVNRKVGLPWIAHSRISDLSKDLMLAMKRAGCVLLKVGVESGSNQILNILSKTEKEIDWNRKTQEVFRQSKEIGLPLHALFIIGNPEETERDLDLTINLVEKIKPESIQIHYFLPYPGSRAFTQYRLYNQKFNNGSHYYPPNINLSKINTKKLKKIQGYIYQSFYLNPFFLIRHFLKYWRFYFYNPKVLKEGIKGLIRI